jgi:uncharacterized protein involved in exopolysaccharide biosynthesis
MAAQMRQITEPVLRELRLRYQAAYSAHQSCAQALSDTSMKSATLRAELAGYEAKAKQALGDARQSLLAALAASRGQTVH